MEGGSNYKMKKLVPLAYTKKILGRNIVNNASHGILFAHATGFNKEIMNPIVEDLSSLLDTNNISVYGYSIDFTGHGDSRDRIKHFGKGLLWSDFAPEDIREVVNKNQESEGLLIGVGHSMGAACLVMAELKYPNMFDGLILYEPILYPPGPSASAASSILAANALKRRYQWKSYEHAGTALENRGIFSAMDRRAFYGYIYGGMFENINDNCVELKCSPQVESKMFSQPHVSIWNDLQEIKCKTLVMCGSNSTHLQGYAAYKDTPELFQDMSRHFSNSKFQVMRNTGHFGPLERSREFSNVIFDFLNEVEEDCHRENNDNNKNKNDDDASSSKL